MHATRCTERARLEAGVPAARARRTQGFPVHADYYKAVRLMSPSSATRLVPALALAAIAFAAGPSAAQTQQPPPGGAQRPTTQPVPQPLGPRTATSGMAVPTDYLIGPDDLLGVTFWRDPDMSGDHTVRPDGMITLPLLKDIKAAGLTPQQLAEQIQQAASKLIEDPNVTVSVRQINSRNVFITGQVGRPGAFPVTGQMTVVQLLSLAGGLTEFANGKKISITRPGQNTVFRFNYNEVLDGKKLEQNIVLKPGDTVLVP
jgi:polysaccharide biosynthesis/export protein